MNLINIIKNTVGIKELQMLCIYLYIASHDVKGETSLYEIIGESGQNVF